MKDRRSNIFASLSAFRCSGVNSGDVIESHLPLERVDDYVADCRESEDPTAEDDGRAVPGRGSSFGRVPYLESVDEPVQLLITFPGLTGRNDEYGESTGDEGNDGAPQ